MGFDYHDPSQDAHLLDWFCDRSQLNPYWESFKGNRRFRTASSLQVDFDGVLSRAMSGDELVIIHEVSINGKWNGTCWGRHKGNMVIICNFNSG